MRAGRGKTSEVQATGRFELAFVLGVGGVLGAHEVGMLSALAQRAIVADVVLGTSVGAVNGAFFAADQTTSGVERLTECGARRHGRGAPGATPCVE